MYYVIDCDEDGYGRILAQCEQRRIAEVLTIGYLLHCFLYDLQPHQREQVMEVLVSNNIDGRLRDLRRALGSKSRRVQIIKPEETSLA